MTTITVKLTLVRSVVAGAIAVVATGLGPFVAQAAVAIPVGFVAVTNGAGTLQISQFRLDGTLVRHLTEGPANHNYPSLSPDGKRMLFTGDEQGLSEIYERDLASGAPPTEVTHPPLEAYSPSWSPDGQSIIYSALLTGRSAFQIFVARADGSRPIQLTSTSDSGNTQPMFSPDGKRIAYISGTEANVNGAQGTTIAMLVNRIWIMSSDGSGARPLTPGPRDAYPSWLDSESVLFARDEVESDTTRIIRVTLDGQERDVSPTAQRFIEPRPLPDGRSYGATLEDGASLSLVQISRTDGAPLSSARRSDFIVDRLAVPQSEGSVFTLAWILGAPASPGGKGGLIVAVALGLAAVLLIAGLGVAAGRKKTNAC